MEGTETVKVTAVIFGNTTYEGHEVSFRGLCDLNLGWWLNSVCSIVFWLTHSQDPKPSKTLYLLSNEIKNPFTENCNIQDPNLLYGLIFNTPLWCWSWNSNTLATSCEEFTHCKRPWCWEELGSGEGDDRGWDGWMASLTQWTWVWVNSRSWWWTGRPGMLRFMGSEKVRHNWATELNWTELMFLLPLNHANLYILMYTHTHNVSFLTSLSRFPT